MHKMLVIINVAAQGGRARQAATPWVDQIRASDLDVTVSETTGPGHARRLARDAAGAGCDAVVAVGGDGTVFEVVNGLLDAPGPALGVLPLGTGNSFVRDLSLRAPEDAVRAIIAGRTRAVDAVRFEHADGVFHYVNILSVGFAARAGGVTNRRYKPLGAAGYVLAVLQCLVTLRADHFPHQIDDGDLDDGPLTLLSFCNSQFTGGDMKMAPGADIADGLVDVVRIGAMGRRRLLSSFPRIFRGTHTEMGEITVDRARSVTFAGVRRIEVMIDGEVMRLVPRRLDVVPGALRVLA